MIYGDKLKEKITQLYAETQENRYTDGFLISRVAGKQMFYIFFKKM